MVKLDKQDSFNNFLQKNKEYIYCDYFPHYHIFPLVADLNRKKLEIFNAFSITDDNESELKILCLWVTGCWYIYSKKWNAKMVDLLLQTMELEKYSNYEFIGRKELILELFIKSNLPYKILKDRIVYECTTTSPNENKINGIVQNGSYEDFDELVTLSNDYYQEEYEGKGSKTFEQIQKSVAIGIESSTLYLLRMY